MKLQLSNITVLLRFIMENVGWHILEEMLQEQNICKQTPVHVACLWRNVKATDLLLADCLDKVVTNTCKSLNKKSDIVAALRNASRRTLFWTIQRGTVLHELATVKCNCVGCFELPLVRSDDKLEIAKELRMYLLGGCSAVETPEKRCIDCDKAELEVARIVLRCCPKLGILRDLKGHTVLMCSAIEDAVSLTKALLESRTAGELKSMDSNFHTALHHAAIRGKVRQVALLLEHGASVEDQDDHGATPVHYAAVRGFCETLQFLCKASNLSDKVRTNNGHSAFMWAAMNGMECSLRAMVDVNPAIGREDCDENGCTALHLAAARDHVKVITTLLFLKWDAEKRNNLGETPLIVAAKNGSIMAIRSLLDSGADYFTRDKFNNTVLHWAANSDSKKEALHELLRYLKDSPFLNSQNDMGQTALHCAADNNAVHCVRYLFRCKADPTIKDNRGWDPFMVTIQQGCWSTINLMLTNSPNLNCYSAVDNQTTLSLALKKKNYILASFLKQNGALTTTEVQDAAVRIIQRWYRERLSSRRHQKLIAAREFKEISYSPKVLEILVNETCYHS